MTSPTTVPTRERALRALGLFGAGSVLALTLAVAPTVGLAAAPTAHAAGDVCDICSVNFDLSACELLGGWPYDSTLEPPPPAISGGGQAPAPVVPAPAPAAPAPAAPAAPAAPQQPATGSGSSNGTSGAGGTKSSGGTAPQAPAETGTETVVATAVVPAAPAALTHKVAGKAVTLSWTAPADGGSPLTGYKLVLNGGTPIALPADATTYRITLGEGSYKASLIATNAVGDSTPVEITKAIEVGEGAASATPDADAAVAAVPSSSSTSTPLVGGFVLGGLALAAVGLVGWWWLRRRKAAAPALVSGDTASTHVL